MNFFKQVLATILGIIITTVIVFFGIVFLVGIAVQQSSEDAVLPAPTNSVLQLSFDFEIVEKSETNPFEGLNLPMYNVQKTMGLNDILARIEAAKTDDNIKGIYLDASSISVGFASVKAIRDAIVDFKTTKKFVVAYSNGYSQRAYYLASAADKIYLNPQGSLDFRGLSSSVVFLKDALDKLGVEMQVVKVGTYKSAVEPFLLNHMSDANREQVTAYLNSTYDAFLSDLSAGRKISVDSLKHIANEYLVRNADDALKYKFIDAKLYKDELIAELKKRLDVADDKDISTISIVNYSGKPSSSTAKDEIAVLYAFGDIVDGEGDVDQIGGDRISRELRKLRTDKDVKAIVLRVNSGGGSALASDIIWREVELTKKVKPIMVSMGDYAASGGYYISAAADSIFAEKGTLTGSIGVFGMIPNFKGLLNGKLGVNIEEVNTGKYASLMTNPNKPLTAEERQIIQLEVNKTYETFMNRVATGRKMAVADVDSVGQGRVWTGQQALGLGLVDRIGNIQTAVKAAASKAGLTDYKITEYPRKSDPFSSILTTSKDKVKMWLIGDELGEYQKYLIDVKKTLTHTGIQMRVPYKVEIY